MAYQMKRDEIRSRTHKSPLRLYGRVLMIGLAIIMKLVALQKITSLMQVIAVIRNGIKFYTQYA